MRRLFSILIALALIAPGLFAADSITATITITNPPAVGATLTNSADVRTWTNSLSATTIQTNDINTATSATNLYTSLVSYGAANELAVTQSGTNVVMVYGKLGSALSYGASAGWASITYTTNTATNSFALRIPYAVETTTNRAIASTNLLDLFRQHATSGAALASDSWLTNFVNRTDAQTVSANLYLSGTNTALDLTATNLRGSAVGLNGTLATVTATNLTISTGYVSTVTITNAAIASGVASTFYATNLFATNLTTTNLTLGTNGSIRFGSTTIFTNGYFTNTDWRGSITLTNVASLHFSNQAGATHLDAPASGSFIYSTGGSVFYRGTGDGSTTTNRMHNAYLKAECSGSNPTLANSVQFINFGGVDPSVLTPSSTPAVWLIRGILTINGATAGDQIRAQLYTDQGGGNYIGQEWRVDAPSTGHFQIVLETVYQELDGTETFQIHGYNDTAARGEAVSQYTTLIAIRLY